MRYSTLLLACIKVRSSRENVYMDMYLPIYTECISHPYELDESIFNFRDVGGIFYIFTQISIEKCVCKQWRT